MCSDRSPHPQLSDLPLWRLIVALADAEREAGPGSSTARTLARAVRERLRQGRADALDAPVQTGRENHHATG
jgi:hypothetical protein